MLVSIIVMLGNHEPYWNSILYDLLCQDYGTQQMELLFVCTSSKQKQFLTSNKDLEAFHRVQILEGDSWLPALKEAAGIYLIRVDANIHISSSWISSHAKIMHDQIICGGRLEFKVPSQTPWFAMKKFSADIPLNKLSEANPCNLILPYAMYRRCVCDAVHLNETELAYQQHCINQGYQLGYHPMIYAHSRCKSSKMIVRELCKHYYKLGKSMIHRDNDIGLWTMLWLGCFSMMSLPIMLVFILVGILFAFPYYLTAKQFSKANLLYLPITGCLFYLGWGSGIWQQLFGKKQMQKQQVAMQTYPSKKIPNI